jgi:hypothetical protein
VASEGRVFRTGNHYGITQSFQEILQHRFRKFISPTIIPEEDQPWHKHCIKKLELTPDLLKFLPDTKKLFPTSKEDATYNFFERIGRTSIKQRKRQGDKGRLKDSNTINQVYKTCNNFFKVSGIPRDLGVNLETQYFIYSLQMMTLLSTFKIPIQTNLTI